MAFSSGMRFVLLRSVGISIACFRCNLTRISWCSPDGGSTADTLTPVASDLAQLTALQ